MSPDTVDARRFERLAREGSAALAGGDHRTAAAPFFAPATERRIHSRDRTYRLLSSRLLAGFRKRLTEKAATAVEPPEYPV
ncbi:hypothetical protein ACFYZJ_22040 [Streptomyces sp. NPDC001848]|uniref:hypothetical protein n=1 Tax=Streptomyces sp. NPDC001848 TaxID=3364618 RepID=UPI003675CF37